MRRAFVAGICIAPLVTCSPPPLLYVTTVPTYQYLEQHYIHVLRNHSTESIFYIAENDTFLTRSDGRGSISLDDTSNSPHSGRSSPLALYRRGFHIPHAFEKWLSHREGVLPEWIEFTSKDHSVERYPGYLPVSGCQSQKYGDTGLILFSYTYSNKLAAASNWRLLLTLLPYVVAFSLGQRLGIQIERSSAVLGTIKCKLASGQTGQIFIKPTYAGMDVVARRGAWNARAKLLLLNDNFEQYDRMYVLLEFDTVEVACATDDVVPLFCEGHELGVPDWQNPLGTDYDARAFQLAATNI